MPIRVLTQVLTIAIAVLAAIGAGASGWGP
jgi:hypothetical protein